MHLALSREDANQVRDRRNSVRASSSRVVRQPHIGWMRASTRRAPSAEPAQLSSCRQSALAPWIDDTVGTFRTNANCAFSTPFMNQIATLPLVSCQRMSLLPGPWKSPVSTIDQLAGTEPKPANPMPCAPFISQIATLPLVSRQRMSLMPSPLKSPVPRIDHTVGAFPTPAYCACAPFMNQIATLPPVSRQRMSPLPSPLKSALPPFVRLAASEPETAAPAACTPLVTLKATW